MNVRVQELLGEQSYAAAIQLIVEGQHVANTYKHFNCVAQLSSRLQDTMELAEEQLDVGLSKSCKEFDSNQYGKLQSAFALLGKQSAALDQLNLHFASGLHQQTLSLLQKYAELSCSNNTSGTDADNLKLSTEYHKLQFHELCKCINSKLYVACLCELSTCLWKITVNYNRIHRWHTDHSKGECDPVPAALFEQKLQHGRTRLWQDVQIKIRTLLSSFDVWHLSTDELLDMLDIVETLVEMGNQFCQSNSEVLRESVRQQSINYFRGFHRGKLDELRVFLENESWEQCPVRSNFNVFHLMEFRFLNQSKLSSSNSEAPSNENFYLVDSVTSPFSSRAISPPEERFIGSSGISDSSYECNDDRKIEGGSVLPLLANTTLSVLRLFGRYIHFMHLLKTIAFDVLICLNQLFDYYLYAVHKIFGTSSPLDVTSPKLRAVLMKIEETLILTTTSETVGSAEDTAAFSSSAGDKVSCPKVCLPLQLDHPNQLYGLKLRLIAAESVIFLARQLELLRPNLLDLIPPSKESLLNQFFSQVCFSEFLSIEPIFIF